MNMCIRDILTAAQTRVECESMGKRILLNLLILSIPIIMCANYVFDTRSVYDGNGQCKLLAGDLSFRVNEVECLLRGYDPFLVWSGRVKITDGETYLPYSKSGYNDGHTTLGKVIHSYPPWSYTIIMPLMVIPAQHRFMVYTIAECAVVLGILWCFFRKTRAATTEFGALLVVVVPLLSINYIGYCVYIGNYGIFIASFIFVALTLHARGHHKWAGCFWALTMVKPQIGLLFFVALIFLKQWNTLLAGGLTVALLSIPPTLLCGSSPIDMILSIHEYTSVDIFPAFGLVSPTLNEWLVGQFGTTAPLWFGLIVGGAACAFLTPMYAKFEDWFLAFLPAITFSTRWAAGGWGHDHAIDLLSLAIVASNLVRLSSLKGGLAAICVVTGVYCRWWGTWTLPLPDIWSILITVGLTIMALDMGRRSFCHKNDLAVEGVLK